MTGPFSKWCQVGLAVLVLMAAVAVADETGTEVAANVKWLDLAEGIDAMEAGDREALLYFTAAWCSHCRRLEATTFADPEVIEALRRFVTIRLDVDTPVGGAQAQGAKLSGVPAMLVITEHGNMPIEGYVTAEELLGRLRPVMKDR